MAYYQIGEFTKKMRIQAGLTQEQLADGILTVHNLSRIENGHQFPNKSTLDALMQRLGLNAERYFSTFLEADSFEAFEL